MNPIVLNARNQFVSCTALLATRPTWPISYGAVPLEQGQARLTLLSKQADAYPEIPPERWAYVDARTIKLLPEGTAFRPGFIYDFWYPAHNPKVLGMGYAATRDLVSFLRYQAHDAAGNVNPVALSPADPGILTVL